MAESESSSWPRSRPSIWLRVKSSGTSTMARPSCSEIGLHEVSQAAWLGSSSATTERQVESRGVESSGVPSGVLESTSACRPSLLSRAVHKVVHRLCTWPDERRGGSAGAPGGSRTETHPDVGEGAVGNLGPGEPNSRWAAGTTRHPQVDRVVHRSARRVAADTPIPAPSAVHRPWGGRRRFDRADALRVPLAGPSMAFLRRCCARDRTMRTVAPRPEAQPEEKIS